MPILEHFCPKADTIGKIAEINPNGIPLVAICAGCGKKVLVDTKTLIKKMKK